VEELAGQQVEVAELLVGHLVEFRHDVLTVGSPLVCRVHMKRGRRSSFVDALHVRFDEVICRLWPLPLLPLPAGGTAGGTARFHSRPGCDRGAAAGAVQVGELLLSWVCLLLTVWYHGYLAVVLVVRHCHVARGGWADG